MSALAALQDEHALLLAAHEDLKQKHEQLAGHAAQQSGPQASVAQLQVRSLHTFECMPDAGDRRGLGLRPLWLSSR